MREKPPQTPFNRQVLQIGIVVYQNKIEIRHFILPDRLDFQENKSEPSRNKVEPSSNAIV